MESFLISTGVVALGEMGDKTQLLALLLATKFKRPVPSSWASWLRPRPESRSAAGLAGSWIASALGPEVLRWLIGLSFVGMAAWMMVPDKMDDAGKLQRFGIFGTTVIAFFLAEMGDKTQIATVALAARYDNLYAVVAGTTLGMMLANVPAVFLGDKVTRVVPLKIVHGIAAAIFAVLGLLVLFNGSQFF